MTEMSSEEILSKFDIINDIRNKMIQLLEVKNKIVDEIQKKNHEEKLLTEYKHELELLNQEKMSHVEELRIIHGEINLIESIIKGSEENVQKLYNNSFHLHNEYLPLKLQIDRMSQEYFGMEPLPNLGEEENTLIPPNFFKTLTEKTTNNYSLAKTLNTPLSNSEWNRPSDVPSAGMVVSPSLTSAFLHSTQPKMHLGNKTESASLACSPQPSTSAAPPPSFRSDFVNLRQQPPPMKSCLSCHQQIHRNAPICPLCKAKSRSRNPKKPKKKDH